MLPVWILLQIITILPRLVDCINQENQRRYKQDKKLIQ